MRKLRRGLSVVLAVFCVMFAFASCGKGETSQEDGKKVFNIGVTQYADHPSLDNCRTGFIEGLKEAGLKENEDFVIDYQSAQADSKIASQIADKFASSGKDLVCGIATPSAQTLYATCLPKNIPVVFNAVSDPVAAGLSKEDGSAMKGITGVSDALPVEAQLKLIREILPDAKKIGILYTTGEANSVSTLKIYEELAPKYGFEIVSKGITKQAEVSSALDVVLTSVDCISNMTDNTVVSALSVLLDKANSKNIPVFGSEEEQVKNGCLASAGLDYVKLGKQAGAIAARILKGEDVSSIPFETMKESKITVNEKQAEKLGIKISDSVLNGSEIIK